MLTRERINWLHSYDKIRTQLVLQIKITQTFYTENAERLLRNSAIQSIRKKRNKQVAVHAGNGGEANS